MPGTGNKAGKMAADGKAGCTHSGTGSLFPEKSKRIQPGTAYRRGSVEAYGYSRKQGIDRSL